MSIHGSSATGHCSNVSDSGRVCNTPRSSVLFDGIPTLTGLDEDMWATQLLTLNTSTSSSSITFDFNTVFDTNGVTTYTGVELIEIVMFNCPSKGIGANSIQVLGDNNVIGTIAIEPSCSHLVRSCNMALSTTARIITLVFDTSLQPYIAEISFFSNSARQCTLPIGELPNTIATTNSYVSTFHIKKLFTDSDINLKTTDMPNSTHSANQSNLTTSFINNSNSGIIVLQILANNSIPVTINKADKLGHDILIISIIITLLSITLVASLVLFIIGLTKKIRQRKKSISERATINLHTIKISNKSAYEECVIHNELTLPLYATIRDMIPSDCVLKNEKSTKGTPNVSTNPIYDTVAEMKLEDNHVSSFSSEGNVEYFCATNLTTYCTIDELERDFNEFTQSDDGNVGNK